MNKMLISCVMLMCLPLFTYANNVEGISVSGKAAIEKAPDQFKVSVTLTERAKVAQKAKLVVDHKTKQVTQAALGLGIKKEGVRSLRLQISPIYPNNDRRVETVYTPQHYNESGVLVKSKLNNKEKQPLVLFEVSRTVDLNLLSFENYEQLLDQLTKIGVTRISPVHSSIANAEQLYQQALEQAVENAKQKAQLLAKKLGVSLGKVKMVVEQSYRAPGQRLRAAELSMDLNSVRSYTGVEAISAEVMVTFALTK